MITGTPMTIAMNTITVRLTATPIAVMGIAAMLMAAMLMAAAMSITRRPKAMAGCFSPPSS